MSPGRLRLDDLAREFARLSHEDRPEEGGAGVKQSLERQRVIAIVSLDLKRVRRRTLDSLARGIA